MGKIDGNFSSKKEAIFSFVFVFGLILLLGWSVMEFVVWLVNLILTAVH